MQLDHTHTQHTSDDPESPLHCTESLLITQEFFTDRNQRAAWDNTYGNIGGDRTQGYDRPDHHDISKDDTEEDDVEDPNEDDEDEEDETKQ